MVFLTTKKPKYTFKKNAFNKTNIQGMLNIFYIISEKVDFFSRRGVTPPPPNSGRLKSRVSFMSSLREMLSDYLSLDTVKSVFYYFLHIYAI